MSPAVPLLLATLAVLPSDRLAMADRLFNRGRYAEARAEYAALEGAKGIAGDELVYRLAECDRACKITKFFSGSNGRRNYGD